MSTQAANKAHHNPTTQSLGACAWPCCQVVSELQRERIQQEKVAAAAAAGSGGSSQQEQQAQKQKKGKRKGAAEEGEGQEVRPTVCVDGA